MLRNMKLKVVVIYKSKNLKVIRIINNYEKYNLKLKCVFVNTWNYVKIIFSKLYQLFETMTVIRWIIVLLNRLMSVHVRHDFGIYYVHSETL